MARWKEGDKINYDVGVYYADTGESVVGVTPIPESLIRTTKEYFAVFGIEVSIEEKVKDLSKRQFQPYLA